MPVIFLKQALFIATERFQLEGGRQQQLIEEGPGDAIILCDLRHFPVDALIEPSQHDHMDTGLGISIGSSHKFHRGASGWGLMAMNRNDSSWDHHHTTTRGFVETVNWNPKIAFQHVDRILVRWALRQYKRLRGHQRRAAHWLRRIARRQPDLFAHWRLWQAAAGRSEPDEPRGSRPVP